MKRFLTGIGLVSVAILALVLTACAPAVTNTPAPTQHASHTAKPQQAGSPSVRVPITCASLFTSGVSSTLVGVPVMTRADESTAPIELSTIAARQTGELHCLWGGTDTQDGGSVAQLAVDIAPDALAGFTSNLPTIESESPPTAQNTAGDKSEYRCDIEGDFGCSANMLVGSYWVTVYLGDLGVGTVSQTTANHNIQQALTTIASALKTATALPAWNPPGMLPGFCTQTGNLAKVQTAVGEPDFAASGIDTGPADAASYAQLTGTYTQCGWGSTDTSEKFTSVQLGFLKGGSWALPAMVGVQDPQLYMTPAYASISIPGADAAVASCSTGSNQCIVYLTIGKTLVNVELDDPGLSQVTTVLAALVTDIKAS
ncbi:MAG TPA: hypothetical protein VHX87_10040 [Galbitalea sp.]|jgi:hypothetical protein|nr:hypothetical protein [Galbitalea sp.]